MKIVMGHEFCEHRGVATRFTSENTALRRLGYHPDYIEYDERLRRAKFPSPDDPRYAELVFPYPCPGRCTNCGGVFSRGVNPDTGRPTRREACCDAPVYEECGQCATALLKRRSAHWFRRVEGFVNAFLAAGGAAVLVSAPLPMLAVIPKHAHRVKALSCSAQFRRLLISRRIDEEAANLKQVLADRAAADKVGLVNPDDFDDIVAERARRWVHKNFASQLQLECFKRGYLQFTVTFRNKKREPIRTVFIPRSRVFAGVKGHIPVKRKALISGPRRRSWYDTFEYQVPNMLSNPGYWLANGDRPDTESVRVLPALLSYLWSLFRERLRKRGVRFQSIDVMERGSEGGYHMHMVAGVLKGVVLADMEAAFREEWHAVSGNLSFGSAWFQRADAAGAARYVSKYVSKAHLPDTRVRSSQYLFLSNYARDAALVRLSQLEEPAGGLKSCWQMCYARRRCPDTGGWVEDVSRPVGLSYVSPFTESDYELARRSYFALVEFESFPFVEKGHRLARPVLKGVVRAAGPEVRLTDGRYVAGVNADGEPIAGELPAAAVYPIESLSLSRFYNREKSLAAFEAVVAENQIPVPDGSVQTAVRHHPETAFLIQEAVKRRNAAYESIELSALTLAGRLPP